MRLLVAIFAVCLTGCRLPQPQPARQVYIPYPPPPPVFEAVHERSTIDPMAYRGAAAKDESRTETDSGVELGRAVWRYPVPDPQNYRWAQERSTDLRTWQHVRWTDGDIIVPRTEPMEFFRLRGYPERLY